MADIETTCKSDIQGHVCEHSHNVCTPRNMSYSHEGLSMSESTNIESAHLTSCVQSPTTKKSQCSVFCWLEIQLKARLPVLTV